MNLNKNIKLLTIILVFFLFVGSIVDAKKKKTTSTKPIRAQKEDILTPGVTYKNYLIGSKRNKHSVHVIEIDLFNPEIKLITKKSGEQYNSLEKLNVIIKNIDSLGYFEVLGGINANFWRAYTNRPIGPTVTQGEAIEINRYKSWTSAFFDEYSRVYIDTFAIQAFIVRENGDTIRFDHVNRRQDTLDNVVYNKFAGKVIPHIIDSEYYKSYKEQLKDIEFKDSSEMEFDSTKFAEEILTTQRESNIEFKTRKLFVRRFEKPMINSPIHCVASKFSSGEAVVPENGYVLSFGYDYPDDNIPYVGETLKMHFETNIHKNIKFMNAVCGTPRLVRQGVAKHEAQDEGSTGRRFIRNQLPRSALGTDKEKQKIFLVGVEPNNRSNRTIGASLAELANIMKLIGCYDAMNLDGGGSSSVVINGQNLLSPSNFDRGRRIAVSLLVVKETKLKKPLGSQLNYYDK